MFLSMHIGKQGHYRKQAKQGWCNAQDGQVSPLPLGLHTEVSSDFMESHFHLPAARKPLDDLLGGNREIRAQECLRFEDMLWIAPDDSADGQRRLPAVIPNGGTGSDFNLAFLFAIPFLHGKRFQCVCWSSATVSRVGKHLPFLRGWPF
jgi:hypothetical protein